MSLQTLSSLWGPQRQSRSNWDVAAEIMRMAAMLPMVREERGYQTLQRMMPFLNAMPEEQRAEWWQENIAPIVSKYKLQGVPQGIPNLEVLSFNDLASIDPNLAKQFEASVTAAVQQTLPPGASQEQAAQMRQNIQTILNTMPLRVWKRPDGSRTIDTASYSGIMERLPGQAVELASKLPYEQSARDYLVSQNMGDVVGLLEQYPEGKLMLAGNLDLRNPQGFLANMGTILSNRADNIIRTVDMARQLFAQNPSYVAYDDFKKLIGGVQKAAEGGLLGPDGAAFLRMASAAGDWVMQNVKEVRVGTLDKDGKPKVMLMPIVQAEQYMAQLINKYDALIKPMAGAIASETNPARVRELVAQKDAWIREAQSLGVPIKPIYVNYYNEALRQNKLVDLQIRERELSIVQAREAIGAARAARYASSIDAQRAQLALSQDRLLYGLRQELIAKGPGGMSEGRLLLLGIDPARGVSVTEALNVKAMTTKSYSDAYDLFNQALRGGGSINQPAANLVDSFGYAVVADLSTLRVPTIGADSRARITTQIPRAIVDFGRTFTTAYQSGRLSGETYVHARSSLRAAVDAAYGQGAISQSDYQRWLKLITQAFAPQTQPKPYQPNPLAPGYTPPRR